MNIEQPKVENQFDDYLANTTGNNDTQMSNNEAFMAFLSKNEGGEDDEEWFKSKYSKIIMIS